MTSGNPIFPAVVRSANASSLRSIRPEAATPLTIACPNREPCWDVVAEEAITPTLSAD
jgi:hypothetical protein